MSALKVLYNQISHLLVEGAGHYHVFLFEHIDFTQTSSELLFCLSTLRSQALYFSHFYIHFFFIPKASDAAPNNKLFSSSEKKISSYFNDHKTQ